MGRWWSRKKRILSEELISLPQKEWSAKYQFINQINSPADLLCHEKKEVPYMVFSAPQATDL